MAKKIRITRQELYSKGSKKGKIVKLCQQSEVLDKEALISLIKAMKQ